MFLGVYYIMHSMFLNRLKSDYYYKTPVCPKKMAPGEVLNAVVERINTGDLDSLMMLYEADACFVSQPGQLAKSNLVL